MSIRLRFTLLYNAILALTLLIFGASLYAIQSHATYDALKNDLIRSSSTLGASMLQTLSVSGKITLPVMQASQSAAAPNQGPFDNFSKEDAFIKLPEREIVRILDQSGVLVASPNGSHDEQLALSAKGLKVLQNNGDWWEKSRYQDQSVLIYSHPLITNGTLTYIIQVARPLTERDRTLSSLAMTLFIGSLITILAAFGIGWLFSGAILLPIQRITRTAGAIGDDRDFSRRLVYTGPKDEVGQLAVTFNNMLGRLQDAYQAAGHSLELQRDFLADVSHELRTPLTTLRGNLGLLSRIPPIPPEEQKDILSDMTFESDRMIRLVNELLVLARADAGRKFLQEPFDVGQVLEETARQARLLDRERVILVNCPKLIALGDRDAFKQVLLVGLDNALKHTTGAVSMDALQDGTKIVLCISDRGEGIPVHILEHIFDRFYRSEEAASTTGFGLGLPIARSLIEGMGGSIWMESQPGMGSRLYISLPAFERK